MRHFRDPSKFRIGDGLAQFEFALRRTTLVHNTEKINVINLTKTNSVQISNKDKKNSNKEPTNYDPRRTDNKNYLYSDFLETLQFDDEKDLIENDGKDNNEIETHLKIHPPSVPYHYSPLAARSNKNSKSKSLNLSKYDHLNQKSNIRKKKKDESNYIPNPSLSSFRVPEQLRHLMLSFTQLEYVVRDFLRNNQYYIQFAEKWKYFSDSFDRFIETASLHFSSNFNYNSNIQCSYRQITKTTPVYLTSEIIVSNFSEFIQQSTEIQSQSSQYIFSIQREFDKIHKLIEKTRNSMTQNRYKTDIPCIKLEEFQNNVISLNEELFPKNFLNGPSNSNLNLNKKRLHRQICELNREIFEIFHKHLKYSFINLAIKIQIRTDLSSCVSNIEESLLVAERTGSFVMNMKDCIRSTNRELTKVLNLMGFPYHVDLDSFNENCDSKSKISNRSSHSIKSGSGKEVKPVNNLICEIDSENEIKENDSMNNKNDFDNKIKHTNNDNNLNDEINLENDENDQINNENDQINNENDQISNVNNLDNEINDDNNNLSNENDLEINDINQIYNENNSDDKITFESNENDHISNENDLNDENNLDNKIDLENNVSDHVNNDTNLDDESRSGNEIYFTNYGNKLENEGDKISNQNHSSESDNEAKDFINDENQAAVGSNSTSNGKNSDNDESNLDNVENNSVNNDIKSVNSDDNFVEDKDMLVENESNKENDPIINDLDLLDENSPSNDDNSGGNNEIKDEIKSDYNDESNENDSNKENNSTSNDLDLLDENNESNENFSNKENNDLDLLDESKSDDENLANGSETAENESNESQSVADGSNLNNETD